MVLLEIPERNRKLYFPEDLSECDPRQYHEMAQLIFDFENGRLPYAVFKVQAVYKLLHLKPVKSNSREAETEKLSNIAMLSQLVDSFFERDPEQEKSLVIKQYYTHNHTRYVRPYVRRYYGPYDAFENMQFGEYTDALNFFFEYREQRDPELLYMLMAIFYRPKKAFHIIRKRLQGYDGDIRRAYNPHHTRNRARLFQKTVPFGKVYGVYLLFASFQKYLFSAKIYWQGRELDLSILFGGPGGDNSSIPGTGMKSIEYQLAESGVFGSLETLRRQSFWEIMVRMYDLRKRDLDYKAEQKAQENQTPKI